MNQSRNFYLSLLSFCFIVLLAYSCTKETNNLRSDDPSNIIALSDNSSSTECFNYGDFTFTKSDVIAAEVLNDKLFYEYSLDTDEEVPFFVESQNVNNTIINSYRLVEMYDESGIKTDLFKIISGNSSDIENNIGTKTISETPQDFSGIEIYFDVMNNSFFEAKTFRNGTLTETYYTESSSPCNDLLESRNENDDDCINIPYRVPRIEERVKVTDWWQIGGGTITYLGPRYVVENFATYTTGFYRWCPDGLRTGTVPPGDEIFDDPNVANGRNCILMVNQLIANGVHDPCNPSLSPGEFILNALGGNWYNCSSPSDLIEAINNNLGAGNSDFTSDELIELSMFPDDLVCEFLDDPIDWLTASPQEKIDKILKTLRFNAFREDCLGKVYDFNFADHFSNHTMVWSDGSNNNLIGSFSDTNNEFYDVEISLQGGTQCQNCINSQSCGNRSIWDKDGVLTHYVLEYQSCTGQCALSIPCISIKVPYDQNEEFLAAISGDNLNCP